MDDAGEAVGGSIWEERPRLRPISVELIETPSGQVALLRDQEGLGRKPLAVSPALIELLRIFTGELALGEIRDRLSAAAERGAVESLLVRLVAQLDESLLLDSPRFHDHVAGMRRAFAESPIRPLRDAATYGPAEKWALTFSQLLSQPGMRTGPECLMIGRGLVGRPAGPPRAAVPDQADLLAIIAPHVDYDRGYRCYRDAYACLPRPDGTRRRFVVLGVNHRGESEGPVFTDKGFATFRGTVWTDEAFVGRLNQLAGGRLLEGEYDHAAEHSIELHANLLAELYGPEDVQIVGGLFPGSAWEASACCSPSELACGLARLIREDPTPTILLGSVDLSHMGRYFDPSDPELGEELVQRVGAMDRAALEFVTRLDGPGLRALAEDSGNPTRICSITNASVLLETIRALSGDARSRLLSYHQGLLPDLENLVTCASLCIHGTVTGPCDA